MKKNILSVIFVILNVSLLVGQVSLSKCFINGTIYQHIDNIEDNNYSDLSFLDSLVAGKRIVFLGESLHGVNDFSILKYKIIRYLHEKHNFEVVAFESGIGSCGLTNLIKDSLNGNDILAHSLMGIWRTKENCEMMKYIKDSHMELAGIDPNNAALDLNVKQYNYILKDPLISKQFVRLDSILYTCVEAPKYYWYFKSKPFDSLLIDSVSNYLIKEYSALSKTISDLSDINETQRKILKKAIESKLQELSCSTDKKNINYFITYQRRDSLMAHNIEYLADTLYKDKKIIIWAHNIHIGKTGTQKENGNVSIGCFLSQRIKEESFIIGLYAINGEFSLGFSDPMHIRIRPWSFENRFKNINTKGIFILTKNLKNENFKVGFPSRKVPLNEMYDGVIFLKNASGSHIFSIGE